MRTGVDIFPSGVIVVPVGSRVTCDPPPTDTDEDYLVYAPDKGAVVRSLVDLGFDYSADPEKLKEYERLNESTGWSFTSVWFGDINYIVTDNQFFFERFLTATYICKTLNLLEKEHRIAVFEAVRGASFAGKVLPGWEPNGDDWNVSQRTGAIHSKDVSSRLLSNLIANTTGLEVTF